MPKNIDWDMEGAARSGVTDAVSWHTIAIDSTEASDIPLNTGTGSLIKVHDRLFILTCAHVVESGYELEKIKFLYRSEQELQTQSKEDILRIPINVLPKTFMSTSPMELPIINRFYASEDCDFVLLELDATNPLLKKYYFFNFNITIDLAPRKDCQIYLMGFSIELHREVKGDAVVVFPYFTDSIIVDRNINIANYDPDKHFLIDYEVDDDRVEPKGLSGCGVWSRLPSGNNRLWTSNLRLVGIQTGIYRKYNVLKATKVEKIIEVLKTIII